MRSRYRYHLWVRGFVLLALTLSIQLGIAMALDADLHEEFHHHQGDKFAQCFVNMVQHGAWRSVEPDTILDAEDEDYPSEEATPLRPDTEIPSHYVVLLRKQAPPRAP